MALTKALGGGSGSSLTVKDEGGTLSTAVTSIDVVGAGATATNTGGAVTLTIPGASGGALVFLGSVTAAAAASADFLSLISSTYDDYELVWEGLLCGTNNTLAGIQFSADNGATWLTSGYESGGQLMGVSTTFSTGQRLGAQVLATIGTSGLSSTIVSAGTTQLFRANTSEMKALVSAGLCGNGGDGNIYGTMIMARYTSATTFNAIRVLAASGTITGVFRLYGRAKV